MRLTTKVILLLIGSLLGWSGAWFYSKVAVDEEYEWHVQLEDIFKHATIEITGNADSCEGGRSDSVGAVLASIFQANVEMPSNRVSLLCHEHECGLVYEDCKPWPSQECGSRILRFSLDDTNSIKPESFACIDMP